MRLDKIAKRALLLMIRAEYLDELLTSEEVQTKLTYNGKKKLQNALREFYHYAAIIRAILLEDIQ